MKKENDLIRAAIVFLILTLLTGGLGIYLYLSGAANPGSGGYAGFASQILALGLFVLAFIFGFIGVICFILWLCNRLK